MLRSKNVSSQLNILQILGRGFSSEKHFQIDTNSILYNCSHKIIKLNMKNKQQEILNSSANTKNISEICINEKKDLFLVAETGQNDCLLTVYQVKFIRSKILRKLK